MSRTKRTVRALVILVVGAIVVTGTYLGSLWLLEKAGIETSEPREVPCPPWTPPQPGRTCFEVSVGPPDWAVTLRKITPWILVIEVVVTIGLLFLALRAKS